MAAQQWQLPGWEEMPNVNRTDYPDHSHYRFARRLQWHRGRTVLWHRIAFRVEIAAHLRPCQRHRNGCAFARPRREHRDGGSHAVVAKIIEEDLSLAQLLRHVEQVALGIFIGHPLANTLREGLGLFP